MTGQGLFRRIRRAMQSEHVHGLHDPVFNIDNRPTWYWFRSMLLDVMSDGGEITDQTWADAEALWIRTVEALKPKMHTEDAMSVVVHDLGEELWLTLRSRGWVQGDGGRWRPPP
jgi:hypothetical protein